MLFIDIKDTGFNQKFDAILSRGEESSREVEQIVLDIIADVRQRGDVAVLELTRRFDRLEATSVRELEVTPAEIETAFATVSADEIAALRLAVTRV
ncbi:MAG: histidinol dehydrogenase, partial [Desulfuromonadaceae bacterium]|nr:histidinol dehydrogenase [Desulfuromonadaceae bacterium]